MIFMGKDHHDNAGVKQISGKDKRVVLIFLTVSVALSILPLSLIVLQLGKYIFVVVNTNVGLGLYGILLEIFDLFIIPFMVLAWVFSYSIAFNTILAISGVSALALAVIVRRKIRRKHQGISWKIASSVAMVLSVLTLALATGLCAVGPRLTLKEISKETGLVFPPSTRLQLYKVRNSWLEVDLTVNVVMDKEDLPTFTESFKPKRVGIDLERCIWIDKFHAASNKNVYSYQKHVLGQGHVSADVLIVLDDPEKAMVYMDVTLG